MRIPSIALVLSEFYEQETQKALNSGMPGIRTQWVRGPVWGKTKDQLRRDIINGNNPISGKPVMQEIVDKLTKPLTTEEQKTGEINRTKGPAIFTDTPEKLRKMFEENRMTNFLPIVLPTEELVNEMLKGTSHAPDEIVGKMSPTKTGTYFEKYLTPPPSNLAGMGAPPGAKMPPMGGMGSSIAIIVTGGTNNNYYSVGGMRYSQSVQIDRWR
jgi:hypothetical protein